MKKIELLQPVQAAVAEVRVTYINKQSARDRPQISTSTDAHRCLLSGYNMDTIGLQEQFVILYLNRANQALGVYRCSTGGVTGTIADPRLIFATALKVAACGLILSHNHPSGTLKPSRQDEEITAKLKEAARFMDIKVFDHIILSPDGIGFFSFADEGLL